MNYIHVKDISGLSDISELNVSFDRESVTEMIKHNIYNIITIKDLYSFALGGIPINQQRFD